MSGSALRTACSQGLIWDMERILTGAQDVSLMRSPIGSGVQSDGWVRRKSVQTIIADRDDLGNTALHICVMSSRPECLSILLTMPDTDANIAGLGGYSPAAMACDRNEAECLRILLEAGVDVNQQDCAEWTLLHHAAVGRCQDAMAVLLEREQPGTENPIVVDLVNDTGHSPLMLACMKNDSTTIRRLILAGADPGKVHLGTETTAMGMCASNEARSACEEALVARQDVLKEREKELKIAEERTAFKESLGAGNLNRSMSSSYDEENDMQQ